ncbi:MAG: peptidoglycan DD-metalloendopeptidase family protein [Gammaproteobacteria bacterium]
MVYKRWQWIILASTLLTNMVGVAATLPQIKPVPGGIAAVPLNTQSKPSAFYNEHQVLILEHPEKDTIPWLALVGLPLTANAGNHEIQITAPLRFTQLFSVRHQPYKIDQLNQNCKADQPIEYIYYPPQTPNSVDEKILSHWSDSDPLSNEFIPPLHGRIIADFGLQLEFDHQLQCQHVGIDIAAPANTSVNAVAEGVILAITEQDEDDYTIFLDHGQGLLSVYAHISHPDVTTSQYVPQGRILGGVSAQADGQAFLHWGIVLNSVYVNPNLFVLEGHISAPISEEALQIDTKEDLPALPPL